MIPDALSGGPHFAAFCEHYIRQTKGRWGGRPLILEGWEREFWWEALELDPTTGLRVYREVGLGIPTKNGKSTQASAGGMYGLVADGENEPEVYVGAASQKQAGIVLNQARSMGRRSPALGRLVTVQQHVILCPRNGGIMRALAADGPLQHGLNPSWNVIDEIHAHKDAGLYTALTKSDAAREQTLTNWITTAGPDEEGLLADLYGQMTAGSGELEDRGSLLIYRDKPNGILIFWYGAPRGADPHDPAVWLAANPASWLADGKWLARQHNSMLARNASLEWQIYHLNQFAGIEQSWLPDKAWEKGTAPELPLNRDLPLGAGIFRTSDSSDLAVAVAQRQADRMVSRVTYFGPDALTGRYNAIAVRDHLRKLRTDYPMVASEDPKTKRARPGPAFGYETWQFRDQATELEADGLAMVEVPMTGSAMGPPSTRAYELILAGNLKHDGDVILAKQVEATNAVLTDRGMRVIPSRTKAFNHGAIALIMAVAMAGLPHPEPRKRLAVGR